MARRRPASWPEQQTASRSPWEPGTALCATRRVPEGRSGTMPDPAPRGTLLSLRPGTASDAVAADVPDAVAAQTLSLSLIPAAAPEPALSAGLLVCCDAEASQRPASHHRRGRSWVDWRGCDHADGAPAACLVAGAADRIALPAGARLTFFRSRSSGAWSNEKCQGRHPDGAGFSARRGGYRDSASRLWVEQPPGHGTYFVEALESLVGLRTVDCACCGKEPKVGVDFLG